MGKVFKIGFFILLFAGQQAIAQISPGELSNAHSHLEGISNCTKCHVLGEKETTSKCLECHTEIKNLMDEGKGYHASEEVKDQKCASCHGEHFGRDFNVIRFDTLDFNHRLAGYILEGKHSKIACLACHTGNHIQNKTSQKKEGLTFLGLGTSCLSCHKDYHQNTLSSDCVSCHNQEQFKPAPLFSHDKTKFVLKGKHQSVDCIKCHKIEKRNNKDFQVFAGIGYSNCTDCHEDVHKNRFGQNCTKCHTENSFQAVKGLNTFDHSTTAYPLKGAHISVDCAKCHKGRYTNPVKHSRCTDCHEDYHEGQFLNAGVSPDCSECHSITTFKTSDFSIEKHNQSAFQLKGSHLATPCFQCHKKEEKWAFRKIGTECIDCHKNEHEGFMQKKFLADNGCANCHNEDAWVSVQFDHNKTDFTLEGKHVSISCRNCHYPVDNGKAEQRFEGMKTTCNSCHDDQHHGQFEKDKITDCSRCHTNNNWEAEKFDHDSARFKLDGKHKDVECLKCHKPVTESGIKYIQYKFNDISCASCHS